MKTGPDEQEAGVVLDDLIRYTGSQKMREINPTTVQGLITAVMFLGPSCCDILSKVKDTSFSLFTFKKQIQWLELSEFLRQYIPLWSVLFLLIYGNPYG